MVKPGATVIDVGVNRTEDGKLVGDVDPACFDALAGAAPCEPGAIAYVGDRVDNDLKPAKAAGMRTVFIRRPGSPASWSRVGGPLHRE